MKRVMGPLLAALLIVAGSFIPTSRAWNGSTSAVSSSFAMFAPSIRVTSYQLMTGGGAFNGATFDLTLNDNLTSNYFVLMRGAAGNNDQNTDRNPNDNYARVIGDPFGNFATTTAANVIRLGRSGTSGTWQGQVTVVEALRDTGASSFRLLDVVETSIASGVTTASGTSATSWGAINKVGLYGGAYGGGVSTTATSRNDHITAWSRVFPSGANTVNYVRQTGGGGALSGTTTFTTYVVEWGSQWTIQRAVVTGSAGGNGADQTSEYDTAAISPVARDNTFVLAYGHTNDNGLGDGWEGAVWTLGNGVNQNATESVVAVGGEFPQARTADVYVHTHPDLAVDYRFAGDGTIGPTALTGTVTVDGAIDPETFVNTGVVRSTADTRFALVANGTNGQGTLYPRPMVWARHTASTTVTWTRSRTGQQGLFWLQSVDVANVGP